MYFVFRIHVFCSCIILISAPLSYCRCLLVLVLPIAALWCNPASPRALCASSNHLSSVPSARKPLFRGSRQTPIFLYHGRSSVRDVAHHIRNTFMFWLSYVKAVSLYAIASIGAKVEAYPMWPVPCRIVATWRIPAWGRFERATYTIFSSCFVLRPALVSIRLVPCIFHQKHTPLPRSFRLTLVQSSSSLAACDAQVKPVPIYVTSSFDPQRTAAVVLVGGLRSTLI